MKTEKIETKDYFMIGWHAYFADKVWDFMIVKDQSPWRVFYREAQMPGPYHNFIPNSFEIADTEGWVPIDLEGGKIENYFKRYAKPESWQKVTQKFRDKHDVGFMCDGPGMHIEFIKPNGKKKELYYEMHCFPEEWHPSYQKAMRMLRYLEKHASTGRKQYACFVG
jgi:hypothetical protein